MCLELTRAHTLMQSQTLTTAHEALRGLVPATPSRFTSFSSLIPTLQPPRLSCSSLKTAPPSHRKVYTFATLSTRNNSPQLLFARATSSHPSDQVSPPPGSLPNLGWDKLFVPIVPVTLPCEAHSCFTCFLSSLRVRKCPFHSEPSTLCPPIIGPGME